jgi:osmotically-inducible protein OsmY
MNNLSKMALALAFSGLVSASYAQDTGMSADETITNNVKTSIAQRPDLKVDHVTVSTEDGTVYIRGMVDTAAEKRDLESIAKKTTGVKKVVNETSVSKGGS